MPRRELARELERSLGQCVKEAETGGGADRRGQPASCFTDGVVADGGDLFEIGLEPFDERS